MAGSLMLTDVVRDGRDEVMGGYADLASRAMSSATSRRGHPRLDGFVSCASQHLHAVDQVVVARARRSEIDVAGFCRAEHQLAVCLEHVRGLEHGSVYERDVTWEEMWGEVGEALDAYRPEEEQLVEAVSASLSAEELTEVGREFAAVERTAPARPHPHLPRRGPLAGVARRVARWSDAFWDTVDNRYTPSATTSPESNPPHPEPGPMARYVMGEARIEDEGGEAGAGETSSAPEQPRP
jgi:hypothetical protein